MPRAWPAPPLWLVDAGRPMGQGGPRGRGGGKGERDAFEAESWRVVPLTPMAVETAGTQALPV